MQSDGSPNKDVLARLNRLLNDTHYRIRQVHRLMDAVCRCVGGGNSETDLNQEDGWQIII